MSGDALHKPILALYSALMVLAQPFLKRKLRRRGLAEPGYLEAVPERFGRYAAAVRPAPGVLWIHAVSLGETRAAAVLLRELRARRPGLRVLLTHGTATGRAEGARLLREGDFQAWLPWDTPGAVKRFLDHFRPALGVLMETEVWPNLAAACERRGVPLVLANGRLSEKSLEQAMQLGFLSLPAYASLAAVWAQGDADARRFQKLGAKVEGVLGNLKFDAAPDPAQLARARAWRASLARPVVMFASSREGEEAMLLEALGAARSSAAQVQWLVVPRHPQRFDEVAALAQQYGLRVSRRSAWGDLGPPHDAAPGELWIGDSIGEMALYYGLSEVALLGGSFAPLGGQNLIEAAACGCPVVMGPHTFNFAEAADLAEEAGAAQRVPTLDRGVLAALVLVRDRSAHAAMSAAALAFGAEHGGAARRTAEAVLARMDAPSA